MVNIVTRTLKELARTWSGELLRVYYPTHQHRPRQKASSLSYELLSFLFPLCGIGVELEGCLSSGPSREEAQAAGGPHVHHDAAAATSCTSCRRASFDPLTSAYGDGTVAGGGAAMAAGGRGGINNCWNTQSIECVWENQRNGFIFQVVQRSTCMLNGTTTSLTTRIFSIGLPIRLLLGRDLPMEC
ncbi:hypothetical protein GOBAR_AA28052 [Gossypium barbadense]|uniref:Uncharacterized protein n=1 Tax=Gossypium barbadense TaxID=3634 RepID=A0A2P5WNF4_GOSBA|nr:hypothetical protein GOBAR_AA28052 [Gossypium barbadense]